MKVIESGKVIDYTKCEFEYQGPKFCSSPGENQGDEVKRAFSIIQNPYWSASKWWDRERLKNTGEGRKRGFWDGVKADRDKLWEAYKTVNKYAKENDVNSCLNYNQKRAYAARCFYISNFNKIHAKKYKRPVRGGKDQWPVFLSIKVPNSKMTLEVSEHQVSNNMGMISSMRLVKRAIPNYATTNPHIDSNSVGSIYFKTEEVRLDNAQIQTTYQNYKGRRIKSKNLAYGPDSIIPFAATKKAKDLCDVYSSPEERIKLALNKVGSNWSPYAAEKYADMAMSSAAREGLQMGLINMHDAGRDAWKSIKELGPMIWSILKNSETPYPNGKNQCKEKKNLNKTPENKCIGMRDLIGDMLGEHIFDPCYKSLCKSGRKTPKCLANIALNPIGQLQFSTCTITQIGIKAGPMVAKKFKECTNFQSIDKGFANCMAELSVGALQALAGGGIASGVSKLGTVAVKGLTTAVKAGKLSAKSARRMIIATKVVKYPADKIVDYMTKPIPGSNLLKLSTMREGLENLVQSIKSRRAKGGLSKEELTSIDDLEKQARKKIKEIEAKELKVKTEAPKKLEDSYTKLDLDKKNYHKLSSEERVAVNSAVEKQAEVFLNDPKKLSDAFADAIRSGDKNKVEYYNEVSRRVFQQSKKRAPDSFDEALIHHNANTIIAIEKGVLEGSDEMVDILKGLALRGSKRFTPDEIRKLRPDAFKLKEAKMHKPFVAENKLQAKVVPGLDNKSTMINYPVDARDFAVKAGKIYEDVEDLSKLPRGNYTYAILADGKVVVGKVDDAWEYGVKHVDLANGRGVLAAGELRLGDKVEFNTLSGSITKKMIESGVNEEGIIDVAKKKITSLNKGKGDFVGQKDLMPEAPPKVEQLKKLCGNKSFLKENSFICSQIAKSLDHKKSGNKKVKEITASDFDGAEGSMKKRLPKRSSGEAQSIEGNNSKKITRKDFESELEREKKAQLSLRAEREAIVNRPGPKKVKEDKTTAAKPVKPFKAPRSIKPDDFSRSRTAIGDNIKGFSKEMKAKINSGLEFPMSAKEETKFFNAYQQLKKANFSDNDIQDKLLKSLKSSRSKSLKQKAKVHVTNSYDKLENYSSPKLVDSKLEKVVEHIELGHFIEDSGVSAISGGVHYYKRLEWFLKDRFSVSPKNPFKLKNRKNAPRTDVESVELKDFNDLTPNADGIKVQKIESSSGQIKVEELKNGVIRAQMPESFYSQKQWRLMTISAKEKGIKVGKTLFPTNWTQADIQKAIVKVVKENKNKKDQIFGIYKGVKIQVVTKGDEVITAYPTWAQ